MNTTLHVPLNKETKRRAEEKAKEQGYSSLQEVIRVFISSFAKGEVKPFFILSEPVQILTQEQETYFDKREKEVKQAIKQGKAHRVHTVKDMLEVLEKNTDSDEE